MWRICRRGSRLDQRCESHELLVTPAPGYATASARITSATASAFSPFRSRTRNSRSKRAAVVAIGRRGGLAGTFARHGTKWPRSLPADLSAGGLDAYQFVFESPRIRPGPEFAAYASPSFPPGRPLAEALLDLTARIHQDFRFDSKATDVRTPPEEVLRERKGVCQDFAHLQIACLRSLNLPARYVSGYLRTYPPPGRPRLVGRGCVARVGFGLLSRSGLAGCGSHE